MNQRNSMRPEKQSLRFIDPMQGSDPAGFRFKSLDFPECRVFRSAAAGGYQDPGRIMGGIKNHVLRAEAGVYAQDRALGYAVARGICIDR